MGFPKRLAIVVFNTQAYRQFGIAVVPAVVEAVGVEVLNVLDQHANAVQAEWTKPRLVG